MLSVFFHFVFFVSGSVSFAAFFAVFLFLGSLFEKIIGSELLLLGVGVGLVFFGRFLPMFLLYFLAVRSRNCFGKILLMSSLLFFAFVFVSFGFCAVVVCCFFKKDKSGSNRTPPHTHLPPTRTFFGLFLFSFCVPPRLFLPGLAMRFLRSGFGFGRSSLLFPPSSGPPVLLLGSARVPLLLLLCGKNQTAKRPDIRRIFPGIFGSEPPKHKANT